MAGATLTETSASPGHLRREVGFIGLTFFSLGSIIGSGWLLGALNAAKIAGPASLISWLIAGAAMAVLALIHAELGGMYPLAGGTARFSHYAFGGLGGFTIGWVSWIYAVTLAPIEVQAAIQYASNYWHWLLTGPKDNTTLTLGGYLVAAGLMLLFTAINVMGVKLFSETNTWTVWAKIAVPVLTIVVLIVVAFEPGNFTAHGGFVAQGTKGIFQALPLGIVFALLGFESAIQMAGEARNPGRDVPRAVITSMVIGTAIYIMLEVAFLGALQPGDLLHGWGNLDFANSAGPYAGLAGALGLGWLAFILYVDAFISPAGTGLIYTGTQARLLYAMGRDDYIPAPFARIDKRGVPFFSIIFGWVIGLLVFLPFPSWGKLVGFITSAAVLLYAAGPVALASLRRSDPHRPRPYRLPGAGVIAPFGFVIASLIVYWSKWPTVWRLLVAVAVGIVLLVIADVTRPQTQRPRLDLKSSAWMWPYFGGLGLISYLGDKDFGGRGVLTFGWEDTLTVVVFSLVIYFMALRMSLPPEQVQTYVRHDEDELVEAPATS